MQVEGWAARLTIAILILWIEVGLERALIKKEIQSGMTYEERESLLELGDLFLGQRVGLLL